MPYKESSDPRNREAHRKHYAENKIQYAERLKRNKISKRQWINSVKESSPCTDCGVKYPYYVMEFDHLDPSQKLYKPAALHCQGWQRIFDELDKCELVCSNCHRLRTFLRRP